MMTTYKEDFQEHLENILNCANAYKSSDCNISLFSHPKPKFKITSDKVFREIGNNLNKYKVSWIRLDQKPKHIPKGNEVWELHL